MIYLFLVDLFIIIILNHPSYLFVCYIPYLRFNEIIAYYLFVVFIDIYFMGFSFYNLLIISFLIILNKFLLNYNRKNKIYLYYIIYFMFWELLFTSLDIKQFFIVVLINCLEIVFIFHILLNKNIKLFR